MSRPNGGPFLLACAIGLLAGACASEDEVSVSNGGGGSGLTVCCGAEGGGGSGGVGGTGLQGGSVPQSTSFFGVPNVDDDDVDGQIDWGQVPFPADNEPAQWVLPAELVAALAPSDSVELTLNGQTDAVIFWRNGAIVLGANGANGVIASLTLAGSEVAGATFLVDFSTFHRQVGLHIRHLDASAHELGSTDVPLWASPLVLNHHAQPAERVWVVEGWTNTDMIHQLQQLLADRLTVVSNQAAGGDIWIQDQLEWATATAPGKRVNVAINSIRNRPLRNWVQKLKAPDTEPMTWGQPGTDKTEDKFGNLETTPPLTVAGTSYPFGRTYYGDDGAGHGPTAVLETFLAEQQLQAPIAVDTSWLCVGHVDEFLSFIPDPSSPKGFKLLCSDATAGYAILDALDPATALPRYGSAYGYATVGALTADSALRTFNQDLQTDYVDPVRSALMATLELDESDLIRVPAIWERDATCPYSSAYMEALALVPGMVNLAVVNVAGEPLRLIVPDPFLRPDGAAQASDPFIQALSAAVPAGTELHFVDDWYDYHLASGEVHCGTNVERTPTAQWWTDGMHLLGGN